MANEAESREKKSGSIPSHQSSGLDNTQSRSGEKTPGGAGGGVASGRPEAGGNRSGGQGNATQQSNVDADRDGPSRQTSTAQDEAGQAS
jgi:hypothetical protein